jgi:hypothetical protein
MKSVLLFITLVFSPVFLGASLEAQVFETNAVTDWRNMTLTVDVSLDLPSAGLSMPTGRATAEEMLDARYKAISPALIYDIQVDSSSRIRDLVDRGEYSRSEAVDILRNATRLPPVLSADMKTMKTSYTMDLKDLGNYLVAGPPSSPGEASSAPAKRLLPAPLITAPTTGYTGVIIITPLNNARGTLPVHGRTITAPVAPALLPKVWDTDNTLIYEKSYYAPQDGRAYIRYGKMSDITAPSPSGLTDYMSSIVGERPLRIFAIGLYGVHATDIIIDSADALQILSTEENRRLLQEGKVAIILGE